MAKIGTMQNSPYFMICLCVETGAWDLFQPGGWYLRLVVECGQGGRILCSN